jgi:hypothetical protein
MHQQLWGYKVEWKSVSRGTGGKKVEYHWSRRPEREADHSSASSAEVKNARSHTSTLPYVFLWWCLIKRGIIHPHIMALS